MPSSATAGCGEPTARSAERRPGQSHGCLLVPAGPRRHACAHRAVGPSTAAPASTTLSRASPSTRPITSCSACHAHTRGSSSRAPTPAASRRRPRRHGPGLGPEGGRGQLPERFRHQSDSLGRLQRHGRRSEPTTSRSGASRSMPPRRRLRPGDDRWGTWWGRFTTTRNRRRPRRPRRRRPSRRRRPAPPRRSRAAARHRWGKKRSSSSRTRRPTTRTSLIWKWIKGSATSKADFGSPLTATSYQLCVYNGTPSLILSALAPAGGFCDPSNPTKACWSEKTTGYNYKDKEFTPKGIQKLILREGLVPGKAKIILKGKGTLLDDPAIPLATSAVTVQLSAGSTAGRPSTARPS